MLRVSPSLFIYLNNAPVAQLDEVQDAQVSREAGRRERLEYSNANRCRIGVIKDKDT
jgi:hypothetical protein